MDYGISMNRLNVLDTDAYPSYSIEGIISMIETLVGHAYLAEDGVCFEIDTA